MKLENPMEKYERERDSRVYRFSSIDEAVGVLSVVRRGGEGDGDEKNGQLSAPSG